MVIRLLFYKSVMLFFLLKKNYFGKYLLINHFILRWIRIIFKICIKTIIIENICSVVLDWIKKFIMTVKSKISNVLKNSNLENIVCANTQVRLFCSAFLLRYTQIDFIFLGGYKYMISE